MNHPVLLPKRKEFGFLKPPSSHFHSSFPATAFRSSRSNNTSNTANTHINHFNKPAAHPHATPDEQQQNLPHSSYVNYLIDPLKLKYENRNNLICGQRATVSFGRSKTCIAASTSHNNNNNGVDSNKPQSAHMGSFSKNRTLNSGNMHRQNKNDLRKAHTDRQAYPAEKGTNFMNQLRHHRFVSIPHHRFNISNYEVIGSDVTGSDTGFAASRILVKREKTTIANCTKCGKLYYDFKCLNCEYGKRKYQFNWRPITHSADKLNANKLAGYISASTTAFNKMNNPSLNTKAQVLSASLKSDSLQVSKSSNENNLKENKSFTDFDKGFKFDIENAMSSKISDQPKLTLYLI